MGDFKKYYLNPSGTLHICGACANSYGGNTSRDKYYNSENQVLADYGLSFKWCKECVEWRENLIYETLKQKELK